MFIILETFLMCISLTIITVLLSFIPGKIIKKIHGYCMGITTGTMSAILFASLIPELLEITECKDDKYYNCFNTILKTNKHKIYHILSILIFLGIFLGWFIEVLIHTFVPEREHTHSHWNRVKSLSNIIHNINGTRDLNQNIKKKKSKKLFKKCNYIPVDAWFYTICNCFHNVTDGILIGIQKKWEIVFALAAHEIPSSLGSLSYYINKGISKRNSIALLFFQKFGFFLGNGIGLIASKETSDKYNQYTNAIIIGMFFYLLFMVLIPETLKFKNRKDMFKRATSFLISNFSLSIVLYLTHPNH